MARRNEPSRAASSWRRRGALAVAVLVLVLVPWFRSIVADRIGSRGMTHHANLEYDEALAQYARAAWVEPGNWRWTYYQALVHLERGEAAQAAGELRAVVDADPSQALAWWRLGEAEFKQGRYDQADRAYARAEADPHVAPHARRGRHRVALASGRPAEAASPSAGATPSRAYTPPRDPLVDALAEHSTNSVFLLRQAAATDLARDPQHRERLVRRALEVDADNPDVVYEVGSLLQQLRRPEDALPYFHRHLEMVDDDQQTLVQIGKCYSDLGRLEEAASALKRALELSDDATGFYNLGFVMEQRGRAREAEEYYRRALRVNAAHASANNNLAVLLAESGRLDEAARHWAAVLTVDPEHVDAHANLGAALAQQGQFSEALTHLDEALRLNPNHKNARVNRDAVARTMRN